jgi:hypothetical protein
VHDFLNVGGKDHIPFGRVFGFRQCRACVSALAFGQHKDRHPTHGYDPTREAAMPAFARVGGGNRG